MTDRPIFHLSFPVTDLEAALRFYTSVLGAVPGRVGAGWADVALFGAQITLQDAPSDVASPMPRTRHFGATLAWQDWLVLTTDLSAFIEPPYIDYAGTEREQGKAMIADPSGNLIELKAYRQPAVVLGALAA